MIIMWLSNDKNWVNKVNLVGIMTSFEILHFIASLKKVGPDEKGLLLIFGEPTEEVGPGLTFVPLGILQLRKETSLIIKNKLPCEPAKIWRIKDDLSNQEIPSGYFPPIRITFGPSKNITDPANNDFVGIDNPYDKQMTTEVTPVISWKIKNMTDFVSSIGTIERTIRQMEDVAVAQFSADFAQITPALALKKIQTHSDTLKTNIEKRILGWGIEIVSAQIEPFGFSHGLNQSVIDVSEAEQKAKATEITSLAEKKKRINEGEGTAEAKNVLLAVERLNLKETAEICKTPEGQIVLWMETLQEGLKNANYSIIPGSEIFQSVAGLKEMLEKMKGGIK